MKMKPLARVVSVVLSLLILLMALPLSAIASEIDSQSTPQKGGVTLADVAAGVATVYDLYGEDYEVHIPDAAETYDPSKDNRVLSEERDNLNVTVVDNGDGTNTMTIYDYPV